MNKHLAGLDHLRALAVILVVLYHYSLFGHPAYLYETKIGRASCRERV